MTGHSKSRHLAWQAGDITRQDRERLLGQRGCVVWFTGLSGSGKSTLACGLECRLQEAGRLSYVLDGDNIRQGLNRDLDFSPDGRTENIRRIGEVAALFADAGIITLVAFISPYCEDRDNARLLMPAGRFFEVQVTAPLDICEARDPKGLYEKARAGSIESFTGISAPYEPPRSPELVIDTSVTDIAAGIDALWGFLEMRGMFRSPEQDGER